MTKLSFDFLLRVTARLHYTRVCVCVSVGVGVGEGGRGWGR